MVPELVGLLAFSPLWGTDSTPKVGVLGRRDGVFALHQEFGKFHRPQSFKRIPIFALVFRPMKLLGLLYHGQGGEDKEKIAMRTAKWKLLINGPNISSGKWKTKKHERFLFRIDRDPNETTNLLEQHPKVAAGLAKKLTTFRRLQPKTAVKIYGEGRRQFKAPKDWRVK